MWVVTECSPPKFDGRSSFMCDETWMMVAEEYERGVQGSPKRCGILEGVWDVWWVIGEA